jgi:hypothetical protein
MGAQTVVTTAIGRVCDNHMNDGGPDPPVERDELAARLKRALDEAWPDAQGKFIRRPSRSVVGTPAFTLSWRGEPSMRAVRGFLDSHPEFSQLSVMLDNCAGAS